MTIKIKLSNPRGFCAGVRRAIEILEKVIQIYETPIYVKHELVHNDYVIRQLSNKGVVFIEDLNDIPDGSVLVFSAHGVSKKIKEQAKNKKLIIFDATCPLVSRVHTKVSRASYSKMEVILIGFSGHPEIEGTIGQYNHYIDDVRENSGIYLVESREDAFLLKVKNPDNLLLVTQTTLSVDDTEEIIKILKQRFPKILIPRTNDICYATFNRQSALKKLALEVDIIFIIGSRSSSNSNRLLELACSYGKPAYLVNFPEDIQLNWVFNVNKIGITAGASTPDILIDKVLEKLRVMSKNNCVIEELIGNQEEIFFNIPSILMNTNSKKIKLINN